MPRKPKRRIMRAFKINEISGVDNPAQEGARVAIMKRAEPAPNEPARKAAGDLVDALTSETEGHQHGINLRVHDGELSITVMYALSEGAETSHDHPIVRTEDGEYLVGTVAGHTHTIDQEAMNRALLALMTKHETVGTGDKTMTDKTTKTEGDQPKVESLQADLAKANAVIALQAAERDYFDALPDDTAKDAFLFKSEAERKAEIEAVAKAADDADPVVYTTVDGVELRKSAGEAFVALAKSNDAIRKENEALRAEREHEALEKRVETELAHLPGDVAARVAMLKAVEAIPDEAQREAALNALKAQNEAMAKAFETHGHGGQPQPGSPDDGLDKLAKAHAEKHGVTPEVAYAEVLKTDEGKALYANTYN